MASTETGEMFTQAQVDAMPEPKKAELGIVKLTADESAMLATMNRQQRRKWLKDNKKFKGGGQ